MKSQLDGMNAILFYELKNLDYDEEDCKLFFTMLGEAEKLGLIIEIPDKWRMPTKSAEQK
jgi:hypothetical protein